MARILGLTLLLLLALPTQAQPLFSDPTVWISASYGMMWQRDEPSYTYFGNDALVSDFSATVAASRWMVRGGLQISDSFEIPIDLGSLEGRSAHTSAPIELVYGSFVPITYRSVYAIGGPFVTSRWFMAGLAVGPTATWGTRERVLVGPCPSDICTAALRRDSERYFNLGFAGSVQGFVRLDGRVWVGGETMLIANASSTHLATRLALRIDLLRPGR